MSQPTSESLTIRPLIGILTSGDVSHFKGNKENFRDIALCGKERGALVFVFTPSGIDWEKNKIRGFLYNDSKNDWQKAILPFPHVVYNRIPTRVAERREDAQLALKQLTSVVNLTFFNPRFFDKHMLFSLLQKQTEVAAFLPETKKLETFSQLKQLCDTHTFIYLKPVLGKAGEGIMRVEKNHQNRWLVRRVDEQTALSRSFATLQEAWKYMQKQMKDKTYIAQQGIPLATYKGRPFDIRVLLQKNGTGNWGVTGVGIRRAGARSITTHVPRGGSILSTTKVLSDLFGQTVGDIVLTHIQQVALRIAHALHQQMTSLAEMSMDLGLTKNGQVWFFEANSKPEKFDEPNIRHNSLVNIIEYATYVSRYTK